MIQGYYSQFQHKIQLKCLSNKFISTIHISEFLPILPIIRKFLYLQSLGYLTYIKIVIFLSILSEHISNRWEYSKMYIIAMELNIFI